MIPQKNNEFNILVVDDDPDLLRITVRILKQENYLVTTATTGQECLQAVMLEKPDLLLLDVMLPDVGGNIVCQTIKSDPALSAIYILLLSGAKIQSDNISEGFESGADGYLIKPIKPRELLARIDAAFRTIRAEKTLAQSRDMLVNLARMVPGVIYQYRLYPDGRSAFPYSSPGMNDIYEVTPDEVREDATAVFGRLHPEDYDHVANLIQESAIT
ncbi:MAG: response regulator, partial [Bacteroidota bacterium]